MSTEPAPSRRPTYRDIARQAGVSPSAVSLALRSHPSIPEATRSRVHAAALALGYRPDPMVTALMTSLRAGPRKRVAAVLGLVLPSAAEAMARTHPGMRQLVEGARERAVAAGYALDEFAVSSYARAHRDLDAALRARNVTGVLLVEVPRLVGHARLDWSRYAVCTVGNPTEPVRFSCVSVDHFQVMNTALVELARRGYRRIGAVLDATIRQLSEERYEAACHHRAAQPDGSRYVRPLLVERLERRVFLDWMAAEGPDALVITDHRVGAWLEADGRRVPDDVALAHTDVVPGWLPFAGVDQDYHRLGATAVELLITQCNLNQRGAPAHPLSLHLPGQWREGPTVRPLNA